jgi:putative PEP-CTERM system histidine kinase
MIQWIEILAFTVGLGVTLLLALFPRFGSGSRQSLLLIIPACLSAGVGAVLSDIAGLTELDALRHSFSLIILAAGGGYVAVTGLNRKRPKVLIISISTIAIFLFIILHTTVPPDAEVIQAPKGYLAFGLVGYFSALFLLIISVMVLANLEQMLRNADDTVRWGLKFLFLGIGALYAVIIYMSSQVLLFSPSVGLVLIGAIKLFHFMFLISCVLIVVSWKRASGKIQITVSHGAIYSSITLLSIGVYLIASSLIARWASRWGDVGLPLEALIFLLSALVLTAVILGTGFRHRTRAWIRRNIFAGRYDYRRFWLEATERVRSIDPPAVTAAAVADIVHRAIGAIDVSVWIRRWDPSRLERLSILGTIADSNENEISGVIEELLAISDPVSLDELERMPEVQKTREFTSKTHASLLVPLLSSNRIVGVITAGTDRSGRAYDWEAREFLRALAGHAAGEFHKSDLLASLVEAKQDEAFRTFSTFVLHDLKNFASTLSYIAQNAPRHQQNPEFQKDAFQSIYETAEKMKRLCNSLRTFSGALAPDKKPVDLNPIVGSVVDTLNAGMSRHLQLELCDLPPVSIDSEEIKRVLHNLILNAREAIPEDGHIVVRTTNNGETIELSVQDNGKGISQEFLEKELFLPFHTTKSGGLGIGLFQSKKVMDAHHGSILVESEEGKGTKVRLIFPTAPAPQIARISQK